MTAFPNLDESPYIKTGWQFQAIVRNEICDELITLIKKYGVRAELIFLHKKTVRSL